MIRFEGVWCRRGERSVLRDVSFDVAEGETLALVGRSGAGKSTALKLINRMLEPDRGRVLVGGRDVAALDPIALRRQTGYVLQEVGLFTHMSVARNVAVVPTLRSDRSTPIRVMSEARRSARSMGPCASTTTPSSLVRIAK